MTAKVEKTINGCNVTARPVYKGAAMPAYWICHIDQHVHAKTFSSAQDVFRFAENLDNNPGQPRDAFSIN